MQINEANISKHLNHIVDFQIAMAKETESLVLDREIVLKGVEAVFNDSSKGKYFVAFDQEKVLASLLIIPEWSDWRNANVWWIHSVYVIPEFRNKKVFKKMYSYLKEIVESDSKLAGLRLYVDKSNEKAKQVYSAIGMSNQHYELFEWLK